MDGEMFVVFYGLVFCAVICAGSVIGLFAVKQFIDLKDAQRTHEVAGPFLNVVGTLYAILLGFLIANSISKWINAQAAVQAEAGSLASVFRMARSMPADRRDAIRQECLKYADLIIDKEYAAMQQRKFTPEAWRPIDKMWIQILELKPTDAQQSNIQQGQIAAMNELCKARRSRILFATTGGLTPTLWTVLIFGGISVTLCAYLFELEAKHVHVLAVVLLAGTLAMNFYLLLDYSYPFAGLLTVKSTPFEDDRNDFKWYLAHPEF